MSEVLQCCICAKFYKSKAYLSKHIKTCEIKPTEVKPTVLRHVPNRENIAVISSIFKDMFYILKENENITGGKAIKNIGQILTIKIIEPQIHQIFKTDTCFNFLTLDDAEFKGMDTEERIIYEEFKERVKKNILWSNLVKEPVSDLFGSLQEIWTYALSYSQLSHIYERGGKFDIKNATTFGKLIIKLESICLANADYNALGAAYDMAIYEAITIKSLGNYYTPISIRNIMIELTEPKIYPNDTADTCYDPVMCTGGFLTSYVRNIHIQAQLSSRNIACNVYGQEVDIELKKQALTSLVINTGIYLDKLPSELENEPYDIVLAANFLFGSKNTEYLEQYKSLNGSKYCPIYSKNATSLLIQIIINKLKIGGRAAIATPCGQDLFSKSNNILVSVRKYLLLTCSVHQMIYLPAGMFGSGSVKTCILYFTKKVDNVGICNVVGNKILYTTSKWQTSQIDFFEYKTKTLTDKQHILTVPMTDIVLNLCSFNSIDYAKVVEPSIGIKNNTSVLRLLDVCLIKLGKNTNVDENTITIVKSGDNTGIVNIIPATSVISSNSYYLCNIKVEIIMIEYLYYYLSLISQIDICKKLSQTGLNKDKLLTDVIIEIPRLEIQAIIVENMAKIYERIRTNVLKIDEIKQMESLLLKLYLSSEPVETIQIGKLFKFEKTSKHPASFGKEQGKYPFFKSSNIVNSFVDTPDHLTESLIIGTGGAANIKYSSEFSCSAHNIILNSPAPNILCKYVYIYLINNIKLLEDGFIGAAIQHISKEYIDKLAIPVPSLSVQENIVLKQNQDSLLIVALKNDIDSLKLQAKQYIINSVISHQENNTERDFRAHLNIINKSTLIRLIYTTNELLKINILHAPQSSNVNFNLLCSDCKRPQTLKLPDIDYISDSLYKLYFGDFEFFQEVVKHNTKFPSTKLINVIVRLEKCEKIQPRLNVNKAFVVLSLINLIIEHLSNKEPVNIHAQSLLKAEMQKHPYIGIFNIEHKYFSPTMPGLMELSDERINVLYDLFNSLFI